MLKPFDEVFEDRTKYGTKIKTDDYHATGTHIIIDQGQEQIAGYTDLEEGLFTEVPAIIFGDHTRIIKYVDRPFFLGADGVKVLRCRYKDANYKYLYYALKSVHIPNTGYNRHFKWLKEATVFYPDRKTQAKIVETLDKASVIIEKRQQQLSALDDLIKARFVEMFEEPVSKQGPKEKLSETGKVYTGNTPSMKVPEYYESDDIPFIKPGDIAESGVTTVRDAASFISKKGRDAARVMPKGSVLVTCIGTIGKVGIVAQESCCNQQINFIVPNDRYNPIYLAHCLSFFKNVLTDMANAPVVPIINKSLFSALEIPTASKIEQDSFAAFVAQIDKSKSVIQKSLDETQLLFDSLMQEYFG